MQIPEQFSADDGRVDIIRCGLVTLVYTDNAGEAVVEVINEDFLLTRLNELTKFGAIDLGVRPSTPLDLELDEARRLGMTLNELRATRAARSRLEGYRRQAREHRRRSAGGWPANPPT